MPSCMTATPDTVRVSDVMSLHVGPVVQEITALAEKFEAWKLSLRVTSRFLGGEHVFPNSRLAVRGESTKNILEDYPYLTDHDVAFAQLFARAYPRVGRPAQVVGEVVGDPQNESRHSLKCLVSS